MCSDWIYLKDFGLIQHSYINTYENNRKSLERQLNYCVCYPRDDPGAMTTVDGDHEKSMLDVFVVNGTYF